MLTIAYVTSRKEPHVEWLMDSIARETTGGVGLLFITPYADEMRPIISNYCWDNPTEVHAPKPTAWQGPHRQTKVDYFANANARNTAICLAPDGWIAFVDDLSVLMPGWLACVREAMEKDYIVCGAYRKVFKLKTQPEISFEDNPIGHDSRWKYGRDDMAVPCSGAWMYGCSLAAPVYAFLQINGYPEACDGMGYEDSVTGLALQRRNYRFRYDRRMLTLESEEGHHVGTPMRREDPGKSPNDKSHAMLARYKNADYFDNPFNLAVMRKRVLEGGEFSLPNPNQVEWFTGTPLKDL